MLAYHTMCSLPANGSVAILVIKSTIMLWQGLFSSWPHFTKKGHMMHQGVQHGRTGELRYHVATLQATLKKSVYAGLATFPPFQIPINRPEEIPPMAQGGYVTYS